MHVVVPGAAPPQGGKHAFSSVALVPAFEVAAVAGPPSLFIGGGDNQVPGTGTTLRGTARRSLSGRSAGAPAATDPLTFTPLPGLALALGRDTTGDGRRGKIQGVLCGCQLLSPRVWLIVTAWHGSAHGGPQLSWACTAWYRYNVHSASYCCWCCCCGGGGECGGGVVMTGFMWRVPPVLSCPVLSCPVPAGGPDSRAGDLVGRSRMLSAQTVKPCEDPNPSNCPDPTGTTRRRALQIYQTHL
jgi:hypothetical protein